MNPLASLKIKIFADGADITGMVKLAQNPLIKGFTTNPTLMRKAGILDYEAFARAALEKITDRPLCLEVFADDLDEMERQARVISTWGRNVSIKIPVTNTRGEFCGRIIRSLSSDGIALNVTALMSVGQVEAVAHHLNSAAPAIISVFAGRVADTGVDPIPHMAACLDVLGPFPDAELLWASPRELLNIFQADSIGCHIITVPHDILAKLSLVGKDLEDYSRETVEMFFRDATASKYKI